MIKQMIAETAQRLEKGMKLADETRAVVVGDRNLEQTGFLFQQCFEERQVVVIADQQTFQAAGRAVNTSLQSEISLKVEEPFLFRDQEFHADAEHLYEVQHFLAKTQAVPIAVGSGTINDLVKRAAFECQRSYMVVGTAASVDGYTSYGASVEIDGMKQTLNCPAPRAVLIDLDILLHAPQEMTAAGYADLLAKIPAGADWMLADRIGTEPIHQTAWNLVQEPLRHWLAGPAGIGRNDKASICLLIEGLIMSGLAMQIAKTSRTASGAEHLFSHLWDNQHHTFQGKTPSHGFKVGIGCLVVAELYEKVLKWTKTEMAESKQQIESTPRSWDDVQNLVQTTFGNSNLTKQVLEQCRQKWVDTKERLRRLELFLADWDDFKEQLQKQILPAIVIREMLQKAKAPSTSEEIGIDKDRLKRSCREAQLIRYRYNILDFIVETGNGNLLDLSRH